MIEFLSTHPYLLLWLGWLSHLLWVLGEVTAKVGRTVGPLEFVRARPYRFGLSLIGAQVGYSIALSQGGETGVTPEVAFGVGLAAEFVCDRAANVAGYRQAKRPTEPGSEGDITRLANDITRPRESGEEQS